jgi:hypothetical protein
MSTPTRGSPHFDPPRLERLHAARDGTGRDERIPHRRRAVRRREEDDAGPAHLARQERPHDDPAHTRVRVAVGWRGDAAGREQRRRPRTLHADRRDRTGVGELDVVGDEELLQRLEHRSADADVDVEQQRVVRREHADVRGDASLDRQEQAVRRLSGPELRDVAREHSLEEGRAVGARGADEGPEAQVQDGGRTRQRRVLSSRVIEAYGQLDTAVVGVHRTARR